MRFMPISSSATGWCVRSSAAGWTLTRPTHIHVEYLTGPMKYLSNHWDFEDNHDGTTTIKFFVDFEFRNPFFRRLMGLFFNEAVRSMVAAFEGQGAGALWQAATQSSAEASAPSKKSKEGGVARLLADGAAIAGEIIRAYGEIAGKRDSDVDQSDRFFRRAAIGTGDTGDGDGGLRAAVAQKHRTAIALATSALTAPCVSISAAGTPSKSVFAAFE